MAAGHREAKLGQKEKAPAHDKGEMSKDKETLARFRPALPGEQISTVWSEEHGCWVCHHRNNEGFAWSEMLPVTDPDDSISAAVEELRSCNICAPLLAASKSECNGKPRVYPDREACHWTAWIPCQHCGGFPWRLHARIGSLHHEELEVEMARLLAHRALHLHGRERDPDACTGCRAKEIASGALRSGPWLSLQKQEWYLRVDDNSVIMDIPLGLPSWAKPAVLRAKIEEAMGGTPYNWEEDGV